MTSYWIHKPGFVLFDVRLMVKQEKRGWSVRLIDFEMCGRAGTTGSLVAKRLNMDLTWPEYRSSRSDDGEAAATTTQLSVTRCTAAATAKDSHRQSGQEAAQSPRLGVARGR